jgi:heme-degrading monooxygenase HmoA
MAESDSYASGDWRVRDGSEDDFVARWTEFLEWTRDNADGLLEATLIRHRAEPYRFVSFARWADDASQDAWRELPEFPQKFGACRELCEDVKAGAFTRVVSI